MIFLYYQVYARKQRPTSKTSSAFDANCCAQSKDKESPKECKAFKILATLGLFISSAPVELLTIDVAYKIYSLRWQIELTFKIWKSICKIDKVKKVKKGTVGVLYSAQAPYNSALLEDRLVYEQIAQAALRKRHELSQIFQNTYA